MKPVHYRPAGTYTMFCYDKLTTSGTKSHTDIRLVTCRTCLLKILNSVESRLLRTQS